MKQTRAQERGEGGTHKSEQFTRNLSAGKNIMDDPIKPTFLPLSPSFPRSFSLESTRSPLDPSVGVLQKDCMRFGKGEKLPCVRIYDGVVFYHLFVEVSGRVSSGSGS